MTQPAHSPLQLFPAFSGTHCEIYTAPLSKATVHDRLLRLPRKDQEKVNAIVRAVNSHDDLVKALEAASKWMDEAIANARGLGTLECIPSGFGRKDEAPKMAHAAIAKAKAVSA